MVIETFHQDKVKELYERFAEKGRQLPGEVTYINSWIDDDIKTCYQVMESPDMEKIKEWTFHWEDLADFRIIPVITSAEVRERVKALIKS